MGEATLESFGRCMDFIWSLYGYRWTIYGYTISFNDIMIYVALICMVITLIFFVGHMATD